MWCNSSTRYSKPFTDYKNCLFWRNKDNRTSLIMSLYFKIINMLHNVMGIDQQIWVRIRTVYEEFLISV